MLHLATCILVLEATDMDVVMPTLLSTRAVLEVVLRGIRRVDTAQAKTADIIIDFSICQLHMVTQRHRRNTIAAIGAAIFKGELETSETVDELSSARVGCLYFQQRGSHPFQLKDVTADDRIGMAALAVPQVWLDDTIEF